MLLGSSYLRTKQPQSGACVAMVMPPTVVFFKILNHLHVHHDIAKVTQTLQACLKAYPPQATRDTICDKLVERLSTEPEMAMSLLITVAKDNTPRQNATLANKVQAFMGPTQKNLNAKLTTLSLLQTMCTPEERTLFCSAEQANCLIADGLTARKTTDRRLAVTCLEQLVTETGAPSIARKPDYWLAKRLKESEASTPPETWATQARSVLTAYPNFSSEVEKMLFSSCMDSLNRMTNFKRAMNHCIIIFTLLTTKESGIRRPSNDTHSNALNMIKALAAYHRNHRGLQKLSDWTVGT